MRGIRCGIYLGYSMPSGGQVKHQSLINSDRLSTSLNSSVRSQSKTVK